MRKVTGDVQEIRCNICDSVFHCFVFTSEDDTGTAGLCSASRCNQPEVVIAEATPEEWNACDAGDSKILEDRLSRNLNLHGLKILRLLRVEQPNSSSEGRRFQDFSRTYKSPTLVYACPCCTHGEGYVTKEYSVPEFQYHGGKLVVCSDISVEQA
jgi:hypothetical protein